MVSDDIEIDVCIVKSSTYKKTYDYSNYSASAKKNNNKSITKIIKGSMVESQSSNLTTRRKYSSKHGQISDDSRIKPK